MEEINQLVVTRQKPFCAHSCNMSKHTGLSILVQHLKHGRMPPIRAKKCSTLLFSTELFVSFYNYVAFPTQSPISQIFV